MAFYSSTGAALKLAKRTGGATWSSDTIETALAVGPRPSVAVLPNGVEMVAYNLRRCVSGCSGAAPNYIYDLELASRATDGGFTRQRIEDVGPNGIDSAFAVDATGMAHLLYYDTTNQDLRHAYRCP